MPSARPGSAAGLQFRQKIRRFRQMERARGDEQNVVGAHRAVLVATVVPSISGNRSRCTPSRLTSAPP